jgi:predicted Ser/Thr protein kinase
MYKKIKQIGDPGKQGIAYLTKDDKGRELVMKVFKNTKSDNKIEKEYMLQQQASKYGICPKVYHYSFKNKCIIMDKMDKHLIDILKDNNMVLSKKFQLRLIEIFKLLDESCVFHNDINLTNFMTKKDQLYIIDFGLSNYITQNLLKKLKTQTPNYKLMTIGLVLKLKELNCPVSSYQYLIKHIQKEDLKNYNIN